MWSISLELEGIARMPSGAVLSVPGPRLVVVFRSWVCALTGAGKTCQGGL
ncbi:MAG: hypothetical protein IPP17_06880 [Bacteroidetes bacterium]|nr:hypothetical protein [Bacteroidota bacterium]